MKKIQNSSQKEIHCILRFSSLGIFLLLISILSSSCEKGFNSNTIIEDIDMEKMASQHLMDFSLIRERAKEDLKTEFVFDRENDSATVFITIGIYPSNKDAESIANSYLNSISSHMKEGPHQAVSIGDKYWWWSSGYDLHKLTGVVLLMNNVFLSFSCDQNYEELKNLVKLIDDDIVNKASYIKFQN